MSRKSPSFRQLVDYIHRDDADELLDFTLTHNIPKVDPKDLDALTQAFITNDSFRKNRANGVTAYHEVLSFHDDDFNALMKNQWIIEEVVREYLEQRAPYALSVARAHSDKGHLHIHLMISGNDRASSTSTRKSKKEFQRIKKHLEDYQSLFLDSLQHSTVHHRQTGTHVRSLPNVNQEQHIEHFKKDKTTLQQSIEKLVKYSHHQQAFLDLIEEMGYTIYEYKEQPRGIIYNKRKYRFDRLASSEKTKKQLTDWFTPKGKQKQQSQHKEIDLFDLDF